jgi:hypothetical protein
MVIIMLPLLMIRCRSTPLPAFHSRFTTRRSITPLRVHAGIAATPFLSCAYFITCGHPGGGGPPSFSAVSAHGACPDPVRALKSTRSFTSLDPFDTRPYQPATNPFKFNTYRTDTKQTTLSTFRMNTYEKKRGVPLIVNQKSDEGFLS